mgnify:CR=1 FL=1
MSTAVVITTAEQVLLRVAVLATRGPIINPILGIKITLGIRTPTQAI